MSNTPLPVKGYTPQSDVRVALVNLNKEMEERVLRRLDALLEGSPHADPRWIAIARSHIEQGFMAMNRAVFQPARIPLPEDTPVIVSGEIQPMTADKLNPKALGG